MLEYLATQRTGRGTSGHESEELTDFLNRYARDGWRLRQIVEQTPLHQLVVFERGSSEQ